MDILLIGNENDVPFVQYALKAHHTTTHIISGDCTNDIKIFQLSYLCSYDCIIIAIKEPLRAQGLRTILKSIFPDGSRILNFYALYYASVPAMVIDRTMKNPSGPSSYTGMILGISHAEVGILPQLLPGSFCNLAISSQDIYYNLKTLEYCINHYRKKFQNLQYLILDLFDYTYFNYDVSLSRTADIYYNISGFTLDAHNFQNNKSFPFTFDQLEYYLAYKHCQNIDDEQLTLWENLFDNIHSLNNYHEFERHFDISTRTKVVTEEEIEQYQANTSIVKKIFQNTIQENIQHFYDLLQLAYRINPSIKVFCILMPRYYSIHEKAKSEYSQWKEMFYTIMKEAGQVFPFTFLDLTEHEISRKKEYYLDVSHLNYYGAIQFTKLLNSYLDLNAAD